MWDRTLPSGFPRVLPGIYRTPNNIDVDGTTYEGGHLTAFADRDRFSNKKDLVAVNLLSNIVPMQSDLNDDQWAATEAYARKFVEQNKEVYIIAGTHKTKKREDGTDLLLPPTNGVIKIPANLWKVMLVLDSPSLGIPDVGRDAYTIGFYMENKKLLDPLTGEDIDWKMTKKSVKEIETITGYNFFSNLPSDIQDAIENNDEIVDFGISNPSDWYDEFDFDVDPDD